jgi:hypothetical protein
LNEPVRTENVLLFIWVDGCVTIGTFCDKWFRFTRKGERKQKLMGWWRLELERLVFGVLVGWRDDTILPVPVRIFEYRTAVRMTKQTSASRFTIEKIRYR